jgi:hypothetical protein
LPGRRQACACGLILAGLLVLQVLSLSTVLRLLHVSALRSWHPFALAVIVGVLVLLVIGWTDERSRALALEAPNQQPVATLAPRSSACEGPIVTGVPVDAVRVWGAALTHPTALEITTRSAGQEDLDRGRISVSTTPNPFAGTGVLSRTIAAGDAITVCVSNVGAAPLSLLGSPSFDPAVRMTIERRPSTLQFSLVLLRPPTSALSLLPTAFSRASLFRPTWVGTWTFWTLLVGCIAAVGLTGLAIAAAARADERAARDRERGGQT